MNCPKCGEDSYWEVVKVSGHKIRLRMSGLITVTEYDEVKTKDPEKVTCSECGNIYPNPRLNRRSSYHV